MGVTGRSSKATTKKTARSTFLPPATSLSRLNSPSKPVMDHHHPSASPLHLAAIARLSNDGDQPRLGAARHLGQALAMASHSSSLTTVTHSVVAEAEMNSSNTTSTSASPQRPVLAFESSNLEDETSRKKQAIARSETPSDNVVSASTLQGHLTPSGAVTHQLDRMQLAEGEGAAKKGRRRAVPVSTSSKRTGGIVVPPLLSPAPRNEIPGHVYVWGSGDCGQLGLGDEIFSRKRPTLLTFFNDKQIIDVAAGGLHSLALSLDGKVYSWGCNDEKALGHEAPEFECAQVHGLEGIRIVQIAAGDSISAALSDAGDVYAWGTFRDSRGILGFQDKVEMQSRPARIQFAGGAKKVVWIAAGANHLVAITRRNELLSWGTDEQSQLGRRVSSRHARASLVPSNSWPAKFPALARVVCGSYHTLAVTVDGSVFSWGLNNCGQLGLGDRDERRTATRIPILNDDDTVAVVGGGAGEHHSVLLSHDGQVFTFGRGDSGQLARTEEKGDTEDDNDEEPMQDDPVPRRVPKIANVRLLASGSNHILAVSHSGEMFAWGFGEMFQLGTGQDEDCLTPTRLQFDGSRVLVLEAGGQHSVMVARPDVLSTA